MNVLNYVKHIHANQNTLMHSFAESYFDYSLNLGDRPKRIEIFLEVTRINEISDEDAHDFLQRRGY